MQTHCRAKPIVLQRHGSRSVEVGFDGGSITSDAGVVLLRDLDRRLGITRCLARCFTDHRSPDRIEHTVEHLVRQRVFALTLGYGDVNDHDCLRRDRALALACGREDILGERRRRERDRGIPLAGKSTLNRLEDCSASAGEHRYHRIGADIDAMGELLVELFIGGFPEPPEEIILDVDATNDPLHGHQEGRFFHGYYDEYCYLPLYIFCGERLLCAKLRTSDRDAGDGLVEELDRIIPRLRAAWPGTRIIVRGDSGFCRDAIMSRCEGHGIDFVLGLARNSRLMEVIAPEMGLARWLCRLRRAPQRLFRDFRYRTLNSWGRERRVVGKAEWLTGGPNPRFVVTSLPKDRIDARTLYEGLYCARGDMENRIKEQKLMMFSDRTSTRVMHSNQIRLYLSSFAYLLMQALRGQVLCGTRMARAQCDTIRRDLLKIGARVSVSVRRVRLHCSDSHPGRRLFAEAAARIRDIPMRC